MNSRLIIVSGVVISGLLMASPVFGQVITPSEERIQFIDDLSRILHGEENPVPEIALSDRVSPFVPVKSQEKEEEEGSEEESDKAPEPPKPERLADSEALELITKRFQPVGSLVLGSRGMLQFSNGSRMKLGDTFNAQIRGENYEVEIVDITTDSYTLRVGEATVTRKFLDNLNDSSRINRSSSENTESGNPELQPETLSE